MAFSIGEDKLEINLYVNKSIRAAGTSGRHGMSKSLLIYRTNCAFYGDTLSQMTRMVYGKQLGLIGWLFSVYKTGVVCCVHMYAVKSRADLLKCRMLVFLYLGLAPKNKENAH
uniref:Uncharacterized protein n=1 Tax=Glossina brevipalpis TaxID=37001 RepID=A0A1A9WFR5_9MUSC